MALVDALEALARPLLAVRLQGDSVAVAGDSEGRNPRQPLLLEVAANFSPARWRVLAHMIEVTALNVAAWQTHAAKAGLALRRLVPIAVKLGSVSTALAV